MSTVSSQLSKKQKLFFKKYYEEMKERFSNDKSASLEDMGNFLQRLRLEAKANGLFSYGYKTLRYVYSEAQIKHPTDELLNELKNKPGHLVACVTYLIEEAIIKFDSHGPVCFVQYVKEGILYKYFTLVIESNLDYSKDY